MSALVFGLFGLIIGSFLNVLILRHGLRSLGGRSACLHCARALAWYELFPVLSWCILRGRCRSCRARISLQYPLVEGATGVFFALIGGSALSLAAQLIACAIGAFLIAISVYDLYHTIIPDIWSYTFSALALLSQLLIAPTSFGLITLLGGLIAAAPLFALWLVSRGRWMGFGDVKLAVGIGWLLGITNGIAAIFLAFVIGAIVSLFILLPLPRILAALSRLGITSLDMPCGGFTMHSEIPFGPFLIASCIIVWLLLIYGFDPLTLLGISPAGLLS